MGRANQPPRGGPQQRAGTQPTANPRPRRHRPAPTTTTTTPTGPRGDQQKEQPMTHIGPPTAEQPWHNPPDHSPTPGPLAGGKKREGAGRDSQSTGRRERHATQAPRRPQQPNQQRDPREATPAAGQRPAGEGHGGQGAPATGGKGRAMAEPGQPTTHVHPRAVPGTDDPTTPGGKLIKDATVSRQTESVVHGGRMPGNCCSSTVLAGRWMWVAITARCPRCARRDEQRRACVNNWPY